VIKQAATSSEPGQLTLTPSGGNRYVSLNTTTPPFDDINVRKAVIANANRTDLPTRAAAKRRPGRQPLSRPSSLAEEAGGLQDPDLVFSPTRTAIPSSRPPA
jgi:peptide/nickel transport system substrate-binding protein